MRVIGYSMVLAAAFAGTTAFAGDCLVPGAAQYVQQAQFAPAYSTTCGVASAPVYQQSYAQAAFAAPVYAPVVRQQVVVRQAVYQPAYVQQQVVVQRQVIRQQQAVYGYGGGFQQAQFGGRQFAGGFGGGGFGGGPLRQGFQSGGLLGAAERFTGLGNGSGDFGRGAIIGVLGARSNLFGLGRR